AGAYGAAMSSTYNSRLLVPEVLVKGGDFALVRPRQTYRELIGLDRIPPWLTGADPSAQEGGAREDQPRRPNTLGTGRPAASHCCGRGSRAAPTWSTAACAQRLPARAAGPRRP